jgi:hypothetical protein
MDTLRGLPDLIADVGAPVVVAAHQLCFSTASSARRRVAEKL